jgi:hypothetical protein
MDASPFSKSPRPMAVLWAGLCATALLLAAGCSPIQEPPAEEQPFVTPRGPTTKSSELSSGNGLSLNGLSLNGLSLNGLSLNGLSLNGLSSSDFMSWFQRDPALADTVMRYVVHCALPSGEERRYTDAGTGQSYVWTGGLGLAPDWTAGAPATEVEQQVVSACLAAHTNKQGERVPISVQGRDAKGARLAFSSEELKQFKWKESCFFGNLFRDEGVYIGRDKGRLKARESTSRACSISAGRLDTPEEEDVPEDSEEEDEADDETPEELEQNRDRCTPLLYIGRCKRHCVQDASRTYYESCTYNGVTYQPLTTRLRKSDIHKCGDGVCQPGESCGNGSSFNNCKEDCGTCP